MSSSSFILACQLVQLSNKSNSILHFYPVPELEEEKKGNLERDKSCLPVCQSLHVVSQPKLLSILPATVFTFISLVCRTQFDMTLIKVCIPVTDVVTELYGAGIKRSDLFSWDWNQTIAWSLSCDLIVHSLSSSVRQCCYQTGLCPQWPHSSRSISRISCLKHTLRFISSKEKLPEDWSKTKGKQCKYKLPGHLPQQTKCQFIVLSLPSGQND